MTEAWRTPNPWELSLMERLLHVPDFSGRLSLLEQWTGALVQSVTDDGTFLVRPRAAAPDAQVRHRVPTEGEVADGAGAIHVLLHVVDGRLAEVEVYHSAAEPVSAGFDVGPMTVWQPENWPREMGWA